MNRLWVKFARLYDLFDLGNHTVSCSGHISVEIAGSFVELKITHCISSFGFYQGEISE